MPKYLLTIQNPPSFTCEAKIDPAEIAMMISARWACDMPWPSTRGTTMPAVVTMATVAEPWATRRTRERR